MDICENGGNFERKNSSIFYYRPSAALRLYNYFQTKPDLFFILLSPNRKLGENVFFDMFLKFIDMAPKSHIT